VIRAEAATVPLLEWAMKGVIEVSPVKDCREFQEKDL
jgi:hypothetical protein